MGYDKPEEYTYVASHDPIKEKTGASKDSFAILKASLINTKTAESQYHLNLENFKTKACKFISNRQGNIRVFKAKSGRYFVCQHEEAINYYLEIAEAEKGKDEPALKEISIETDFPKKVKLALSDTGGLDCLIVTQRGFTGILSLETKKKGVEIYTAFSIKDKKIEINGEALPDKLLRQISYNKKRDNRGRE